MPEHFENVVRIGRTADEIVAALDVIAFLDVDHLRLLDEVGDLFRTVIGDDHDLALGLIVLLEADLARDLGDDRRVLGLARFEQFGDARQTAGDVARLGGLTRQSGEHFAGLDRLEPSSIGDDRAREQAIKRAFDLVLAQQGEARTKVLLLRLGEIVHHHALRDAGRFVGLFDQRAALDQVLILHRAGALGDDRGVGRIPLGDAIAAADDMAGLAQQMRAVRNAVGRKLAPVHVEDRDFARARQADVPAARIGDRRHVAKLDRAVDRRFEVRLLVELRRAADVEGPHRQLGAGLADRLGGDDADRFADVDRGTARKVAAVAARANALLRRAHQRRADLDPLEADGFQRGNHRFVEQGALADQHVARSWDP